MAIALDTSLGTVGGRTGTSWVLTTSAAAAVGRIILGVSWFTSTITVSSVSGGGLTWVIDKQSATDSGEMLAFVSADAPSGLASSTAITVTPSASLGNTSGIITAGSFIGLETGASGYLTGTPPAPDTTFSGSTWTSPNITTADADALIYAISANDGVTPFSSTATTGTELHDHHDSTATQTQTTVYRIVSSTGTYNCAGTWSGTLGENRRGTVAYKASVTAPPTDAPEKIHVLTGARW